MLLLAMVGMAQALLFVTQVPIPISTGVKSNISPESGIQAKEANSFMCWKQLTSCCGNAVCFVKDHLLVPILQNGKVAVCVVGHQLDRLNRGGKVAVEVAGQVVPLLKLVLLPAATAFTGDRVAREIATTRTSLIETIIELAYLTFFRVVVPFFIIILVVPLFIAVLFKF